MRGWRFVIDEAGFAFESEVPTELEEDFAQYLDVLEYVRTTPGTVKRSDVLFDIESASGATLVDHLCDPRINRDIRHELHGRLDKIAEYDDDLEDWEFLVDSTVLPVAPSIGICSKYAAKGVMLACLTTMRAGRRGARAVRATSGDSSVAIHFVADSSDGPSFWRAIIDAEPDLLDDFADHQHLAFPNTVFAENIWDQISRFDGSSLEVRRALIANLGGLDDYVLRIWAEHSEPIQRIKQMQIAASVNCSPESPNTHKNSKAMHQRLVEFDGEQITCQWHAKLERHRNRIHFAVHDGRLFVGIFADHLLL
ncbi:hypothetical protein [Nocardia camponoti]|uniref:Uncharacterized protein n=1 Tax=Nocardia camponoti TaxID=1616106 RepID=A0A917QTH0_9NOCA|nr:hypothetical protein [Nocardia camponoti]GGK67564.1 hypothetical protein GCM10011591_44660 [Nocardia camponoti]